MAAVGHRGLVTAHAPLPSGPQQLLVHVLTGRCWHSAERARLAAHLTCKSPIVNKYGGPATDRSGMYSRLFRFGVVSPLL